MRVSPPVNRSDGELGFLQIAVADFDGIAALFREGSGCEMEEIQPSAQRRILRDFPIITQ